jgi:probable F420-dependent oxidoreductase
MKVDTRLTTDGRTLAGIADETRSAVANGYHGVWSTESRHDPFLPLVGAAAAAPGVQLGTAVAIAFARSPMTTAQTAHDLQVLTGGRFLLGLGSQVKAHVERRFAMPWSRPAARMREYVCALHAIWNTWNTGARLDFRGDFYQHTLMTPFFTPERSEAGPPTVYLAAVGEHMTRVAGEVCDGLMPHPFTTQRYLRERTLPAVHAARERAGRPAAGFSVSLQGMVVTGRTEEEMAEAVRGTRRQIAFYASTPAYRPVLALHGWEHLGEELTALSHSESEGRWQAMGDLIDDEVLHAIAVVAEPERLGDAVLARFGDLVDRFSFYAPYQHDPQIWRPAIDTLTGVVR